MSFSLKVSVNIYLDEKTSIENKGMVRNLPQKKTAKASFRARLLIHKEDVREDSRLRKSGNGEEKWWKRRRESSNGRREEENVNFQFSPNCRNLEIKCFGPAQHSFGLDQLAHG